jgi:hypothetical protein
MVANREHSVLGTFKASRPMTGHSPIHLTGFSQNVLPQRLESSLRDHNLSLTQVVLVDTGADGLAPTPSDRCRT